MKNSILLVPFLLVLAACSPAPSDESAPVAETQTQVPAGPQVEVAATTMIHAEPASLAACKADKVVLKWDVRKAKPGVSTIKIYTESGKLFAHAGASGRQETGAWVKPGSVFVIKDATTDAELERLTIGGPICP